jgi:hypothetical protein
VLTRALAGARSAAASTKTQVRVGTDGLSGLRALHAALSVPDDDSDIEFVIYEAPTASALEQLDLRALDLAIVRPPIDISGVSDELLLVENREVVVRLDHHLASRSSAALAEFADDAFVLPPIGQAPRLRRALLNLCKDHGGFEPKRTHDATSVLGALGLVASRGAVALLPRGWSELYTFQGVRAVSCLETLPGMPLRLAWPARGVAPAVRLLRDQLLTTPFK